MEYGGDKAKVGQLQIMPVKCVPQRQCKWVDNYLNFDSDCSQSETVGNCGIEWKTSRSGLLKRCNDGSISGYRFTNG